jgi:integration host factor subunit beta
MPTITKKDFVDRIAETTQCKHVVVKAVVQQFLDEIVCELAKGNRLEFRDFGVFEVSERAPRKAHNPQTLEPIDVPAKRRVKFKMGRGMRERMNGEAVIRR